ncbi:MAG: SBBP repeat-containing protein [Verrucomicrobiae bacterium]|nr:SBBP repeat-containing protein [Verrucomicrobiae bacterium]
MRTHRPFQGGNGARILNRLALCLGLVGGLVGSTVCPATIAERLARNVNMRPLTFEQNLGQYPGAANFVARGPHYQLTLAPTELTVTVFRSPPPASERNLATRHQASSTPVRFETLAVELLSANPRATIAGEGELAGRANYLVGDDPAQWRTGVPFYERVRVKEVYPGINLVHYGNQNQLEYDFEVQPGADPELIRLAFRGVSELHHDAATGELVFKLGEAELRQPKPVVYQNGPRARTLVSGDYVVETNNIVRFDLGAYDRTQPLIIDPLVSYARTWGGSSDDVFWAVALDSQGNIYVAGETMSLGLASAGAAQTNLAGALFGHGDVLVAKMDNRFQATNYITYIGGAAYEAAFDLAVDAAGNAYVTGYTGSTNFPVVNALQPEIGGRVTPGFATPPLDAFVTKISASGSNLLFSTFLGGRSDDVGLGIALDSATNIYVVGQTLSTNFPTANTTNTSASGFEDAFVVKLAASGTNLLYARYLGGTGHDYARGVAVSSSDDPVVVGYTTSSDFPITTNALQTALNNITNTATAAEDAFICQLEADTGAVQYATYLGGAGNDEAFRLALDSSNRVYVVGQTWSHDFPRTSTNFPSAVLDKNSSLADAFVTRFALGATNWDYSVVFGGAGAEVAWGIAVDAMGRASVAGETSSSDFPTNQTAVVDIDGYKVGGVDAFIAQLNAAGDDFIYSGYIGSLSDDLARGAAVDRAGNVYYCGETAGGGNKNGFIVKVLADELPELSANLSQTNFDLTWSGLFPELRVQTTTDLASSNSWVNLGQTATLTNFQSQISVPATNPAQYFRLRR